jgi:hypothetical protein
MGIVEGNELPYRPEALAKKRQNFENRMTVKVANDPSRYDSGDPELQCYRPGVPRANYMPFPFQIFQNREQIMIVYEYKWSVRWIYMDANSEAPVDSWMGWSNGRWEGDTLVVDTVGINERGWIDAYGTPTTKQLHLVEKWTRLDFKTLRYEITVDDPGAYTAPFTTGMLMTYQPGREMFEFVCQDGNLAGELMIGGGNTKIDRTSPVVP